MPNMRHRRTPGREAGAGVAKPAVRWARLTAATVALALIAGCQPGSGDSAEPAAEAPLADDAQKASYALGYRFAENVQRQFPEDIDSDAFVRGVRDQLTGADNQVSDEEAERVLTAMMEARQAEAANEALETLEAGLAFLEENARRDEVTVLESGLQYEVLEEGEGAKPGPADTVTTHYEGRLIDGTVFDSSYERGEPASFPLNRVIPGWTEGLQLMSPGAKYRLYVPAELAYGDRAAGQIPPNSALIFDVELLEVDSSDDADGSASAGDEGDSNGGG